MAQIFKFSRHADQLTEIEKEKLRNLKYSQINAQVDEIPPEEVAYSISDI